MSKSLRTGGCLCGAVRYSVAGALRPVVVCHCTQCRRMTGHVMAATAARRGDFRLVSERELKWYAASNEARRGFCGRCGSTLFWEAWDATTSASRRGAWTNHGASRSLPYLRRRQG